MSRAEQYTCTISRDTEGRIDVISLDVTDLEDQPRHVHVDGVRAIHVAAPLQDILRSARLRGSQLSAGKPLTLTPTLGAHVELLLRAVKPLRRLDRISDVSEGIAGMSREEAAYWHAQTQRRHGLKALRILLDGGIQR